MTYIKEGGEGDRVKLTEQEIGEIAKREVPDKYKDIPYQYVELGAKAQLKKILEGCLIWGQEE